MTELTITIAPAGPKTGAATIRALLQPTSLPGPSVRVKGIYRNISRVPREFTDNPRFEAVKGDIADPSSLDFSDSDAVLTITPPHFDSRDMVAEAERVSQNVRDAVERADSVKKLVLLSSVGAHLSEGVGEIKTNNRAEKVLSHTKVAQVIIARCGYFMENWASSIPTLNSPEPFIYSTITPLDYASPMVSVRDIGIILAQELLLTKIDATTQPTTSPYIFELHGPGLYTPLDVQEAFSKALNGRRVDIKAIEKDKLYEFFVQFMPPNSVKETVEMTVSFLPGGKMIQKPDRVQRDILYGTTTLDEAIKAIVDAQLSK